jgi:cytochrome b561
MTSHRSTAHHTDRYTAIAIALHWLLAVMIVISFSVGVTMSDLPFSPTRLKLYNWHKWAGMTILLLSALRLVWRLTHKPPAHPPMPTWQRRTADGAHAALYLLFFAVPVAGWAYSSAAGFPIVLYGLIPFPNIAPVDRALAETLKAVHGALAFALAGVVLLHVAAALKHQFIDRDGLLSRMRPGPSR